MGSFTGAVTPGSITTRDVTTTAADVLTRDQVRHLHKAGTSFALAVGGTPATREEIIFTASTSGTVRAFKCLMEDTGTAASSTFDLKKYATGGSTGSSVLSAAVTVSNADTDNTPKSGTINSASFVAGDVFTILLTVSTSTGAAGPYAWAEFDELAGA
jgi:hypothetical protein